MNKSITASYILSGAVKIISMESLAEDSASGGQFCRQVVALQERLNLSRWTAEDYLAEVSNPNAVFTVAVFGNEIIAFLLVRLTYQRESLPGQYEEADLLNFGVSKSFQRQGIGSVLFAGLIGTLQERGVSALWLEVRESNSNAVEFYLNKGFKIIQNRKNFYSNPSESGLVLKLELPADYSDAH